MVADPPRFAQKISEIIIGTGLNFNSCANSTVTAAKKRITVILSINIANMADITINVIKIGIVLYFTAFAIRRQSQRKNPARPIPSTINIIPAIKRMVAQLMPADDSADSPA